MPTTYQKMKKNPWTSLIHLPDSYRYWLFSDSLCVNIRWLECLPILKTKKVQKCLSRKTGVFTEFTFCYLDKLSVLHLDFFWEYLYCIKTFKELYPFGKWYISDLTTFRYVSNKLILKYSCRIHIIIKQPAEKSFTAAQIFSR